MPSALCKFSALHKKNSFRIDWIDLLAVQGSLKSLLQHQSSKTLILIIHTHTHIYIYIYREREREGNGNPLQYSSLENLMDGEAC